MCAIVPEITPRPRPSTLVSVIHTCGSVQIAAACSETTWNGGRHAVAQLVGPLHYNWKVVGSIPDCVN